MDSQQTKTDNFELPPPTAGPAPVADPSGAAPDVSDVSAQAPTVTVSGASAPLAMSANASTGGLEAEDVDLIEKAWIEKAKVIVAETRGDPFLQNKEINKVKADYIKKRYNKDIKLASE